MTSTGSKAMRGVVLETTVTVACERRDEGSVVDQWGIYFFASYPQCKNDGAVGDRVACMDVHGAE